MHEVIIYNEKNYPNGIAVSLDDIDIQGGEPIINTSMGCNGHMLSYGFVTPIIIKFTIKDPDNLERFVKLIQKIKGNIDKLVYHKNKEIFKKGIMRGYFNGTYEYNFETKNNLA